MAKNQGVSAIRQTAPVVQENDASIKMQAAMTVLIRNIVEAGDSVRRV